MATFKKKIPDNIENIKNLRPKKMEAAKKIEVITKFGNPPIDYNKEDPTKAMEYLNYIESLAKKVLDKKTLEKLNDMKINDTKCQNINNNNPEYKTNKLDNNINTSKLKTQIIHNPSDLMVKNQGPDDIVVFGEGKATAIILNASINKHMVEDFMAEIRLKTRNKNTGRNDTYFPAFISSLNTQTTNDLISPSPTYTLNKQNTNLVFNNKIQAKNPTLNKKNSKNFVDSEELDLKNIDTIPHCFTSPVSLYCNDAWTVKSCIIKVLNEQLCAGDDWIQYNILYKNKKIIYAAKILPISLGPNDEFSELWTKLPQHLKTVKNYEIFYREMSTKFINSILYFIKKIERPLEKRDLRFLKRGITQYCLNLNEYIPVSIDLKNFQNKNIYFTENKSAFAIEKLAVFNLNEITNFYLSLFNGIQFMISLVKNFKTTQYFYEKTLIDINSRFLDLTNIKKVFEILKKREQINIQFLAHLKNKFKSFFIEDIEFSEDFLKEWFKYNINRILYAFNKDFNYIQSNLIFYDPEINKMSLIPLEDFTNKKLYANHENLERLLELLRLKCYTQFDLILMYYIFFDLITTDYNIKLFFLKNFAIIKNANFILQPYDLKLNNEEKRLKYFSILGKLNNDASEYNEVQIIFEKWYTNIDDKKLD
jgi:hypothetical protein